jgi:hypothetical protein
MTSGVSTQDKVIFLYNKFFYSFVEDLIKTCAGLKATIEEKCKVRNTRSEKHIQRFSESLEEGDGWEYVLSGKPLREAEVSIRLIKSITLKDILSEFSDEKDIVTAECYTYIFTLFAYLNTQVDEDDIDTLFNVCTSAIRDIQKGEDYKANVSSVYDEKLLALLDSINKSMAKSKICDVGADDEEPEGVNETLNMLENSKIGNLAKEISDEIDLSNIKVDKPEDLIGSLLSGDGALNSIIGKVGSKIQSKIASGELKHEELLSDAFSMLSMLNKGGSGGGAKGAGTSDPLGGMGAFMNNPMFAQMMKGMQSGMFTPNHETERASSTRDRLRKKHSESKRSE